MNNKILWIALTVLWVLLAVPSAGAAVMSVMMFDAPGSAESHYTWMLFWSMVALPFAWVLGAGVPWIFYKKRWGIALFLIPIANVAVIAAIFELINARCGGSLTCK